MDKQYVNDFATYVNNIAKERLKNIKNDKIAIITTNWDILLDNSLNDLAKSLGIKASSFASTVNQDLTGTYVIDKNSLYLKFSKESITCVTPGSFSYSSFLLAESTTTIF